MSRPLCRKTTASMNYSDKQELARIISRKATCGIPEEDEAVLNEWLARSAANRELYVRIMNGESLHQFKEKFPESDIDRHLSRINEKIRVRRNRRRIIRTASVTAAAVIASLVIILTPWSRSETPEQTTSSRMAVMHMADGSEYVLDEITDGTEWKTFAEQDTAAIRTDAAEVIITITIPRGGRYRLKLDDGTQIWLNADTEISYPKVFSGNRREVFISGEAYLDVAPDPQIPFVVKLDGDMAVMVHGTRFNVQTYPGGDNTYITLAEGAVTVNTGRDSVDIHPNQQIVVDRLTNGYMVNDIPDAHAYTCWTEGVFFLKQTPVTDIFSAMERWYDINIVYDDDDEIRQLGNFTVKSSLRDDFIPMLDALARVSGLQYTVQGRTVLLELAKE